MNLRILAAGGAVCIPLVVLLATGFGRDPKALPDALAGRQAPDFVLTDLDGNEVSSDELRGKPVVLNFWSTWCGPCAIEHPILLEGARRYGPNGVVFLGVLYGDEPSKAKSFLETKGAAYPTLVDPGQRTAIDYGVAGVPETFFLSPDGTVARKISGPVSAPALVETLEELL